MPTRILIRGGWILSLDDRIGELPRGDVLIEDDTIVAVDRRVPVTDAEIIDASRMVVLPGFVDTHRHTWQSVARHQGSDWTLADYRNEMFDTLGPRVRPADVYIGALISALAALDGGVTTLVDWAHIQNSPAHADAALDALRAAGIRAMFAHGWPGDDAIGWLQESTRPHPTDLRRLRHQLSNEDALITLAMAARGPAATTMEITAADLTLARELGLRISMHIFGPHPSVERLHAAGLLGPDLTLVHVTDVSDEALELMAAHGVTASVSPQLELTMAGLGRPTIGRLLAAGIQPSLSVDTETAAAADMFTQLRLARAAHPATTAREALAMATTHGAHALGLDHRIGSLTPGKQADLIMIDIDHINLLPVHDPVAALVTAAHPGNVNTVLVAGRIRKRAGRLTADTRIVSQLVAASCERLFRDAPDGLPLT